jgi:SAM-dependent methyltransferase
MSAHWVMLHSLVEDGSVHGYDSSSYGDAFADIYDEWYHGISDIETTVELLGGLTEGFDDLAVLELGVGTGRLAVPLAATGVRVVGIDSSAAMLARLAENDPHTTVTAVAGDMVDDVPEGPFGLVFVAYNTFFNLLTETRQRACLAAVAGRLAPGGAFVVEAFVPEPQPGSSVTVRSMAVDSVVLSVTTHDATAHTAQGQYVEITESGGVRLRPWAIRYASVTELDDMAAAAGLHLSERWEDMGRTPFTSDSPRHVSVYRTNRRPVRPEAGPTS